MLDMLYYLDLRVVFRDDKPGDWGSHLVTGGAHHRIKAKAWLTCGVFLGTWSVFVQEKDAEKGP